MTGSSLLANLTPASTVLSPDRGRVLTFDREGRVLYYFRRGVTFKRSLASDVHLRFRTATRQRRQLQPNEARRLFEEVAATALELAPMTTGEARRRLTEEILPWTTERLAAEKERFAAAYKPITILPPDQYLAIVLQATEGCSWNRCTFCNFYMDRPFQLTTRERFEEHCLAVRSLLGKGLRMRRGLFLADGNALALSNRRLAPLIEIATRIFPDRKLYGFIDVYSGERRSIEDWRDLQQYGLERVYIGMETGSEALLEFVNKPGTPDELVNFISILKSAGLAVSLIIMVGLGGRRFRLEHRRNTCKVLERMPLDSADLVYLSPFVEHGESEYMRRRLAAGIESLSDAEVEVEIEDMTRELRGTGLRVGRYDIREFVY